MFGKELERKVTANRIYIWNALGSLCNAASTVLFLLIVTRILGAIEGGVFSVAFALSQQMLTVASFETATYQVTDGTDSFDFGSYLFSRVLLYIFSIVLGLAIAALSSYSLYKCAVVVLLCMYKGLDAFNATFTAAMQKKGRLDIGGKSFALRILISMIIFVIAAVAFKNLLISIILMLVFSVFWTFLYEMRYTAFFEKIRFNRSPNKTVELLLECLPLFLGNFLMTYICNQPKYAVDSILSNETLNTVFGIVFMPSAIISLLSIFIYRPVLTELTRLWISNNRKVFVQRILKLCAFVSVSAVACVIVGYVFGIPLLSFIYGVDLSGYRATLCIAMVGGGLYALASLVYNAIVILRRQKLMIICYLLGSLFAFFLAPILVRLYGLNGGALAYLFSCTVLFVSLIALLTILLWKSNKAKLDKVSRQ